ncbi:hypothetical protein [Rathayibacter sp. VKM Ac-2805]|uniref:hypothetical protein n=1 Tax=Rathayibacter sp. VKM Ac-2805 TaxID=2609258 RepID=UPI0013203A2A|nr:hypothetical protein [Rathayibacter sp. VKM Ac-2805]QHC75147.1 hypothetical protein GSU40_16480 [Rathayibacter sp. VKM Ac-2805]
MDRTAAWERLSFEGVNVAAIVERTGTKATTLMRAASSLILAAAANDRPTATALVLK